MMMTDKQIQTEVVRLVNDVEYAALGFHATGGAERCIRAKEELHSYIAQLERIAGDLQTLCDKQALMLGERDAQLESVGAGGVGAMIPKTIPDRTALIDLIAEHLSGTYHCTRVWSAWCVGTMSQDDFADVGESDTPSEIAEAIIATLISQQIAEPASDLHQEAASRLADLIDIYDDRENNAPEHRCYVPSAWSDTLAGARVVLLQINAIEATTTKEPS